MINDEQINDERGEALFTPKQIKELVSEINKATENGEKFNTKEPSLGALWVFSVSAFFGALLMYFLY